MVCTANDVLEKFRAVTALTYDSYICLLVKAHTMFGKEDVQLNGRRAKFVSLVAGFATARFHYHLCRYAPLGLHW